MRSHHDKNILPGILDSDHDHGIDTTSNLIESSFIPKNKSENANHKENPSHDDMEESIELDHGKNNHQNKILSLDTSSDIDLDSIPFKPLIPINTVIGHSTNNTTTNTNTNTTTTNTVTAQSISPSPLPSISSMKRRTRSRVIVEESDNTSDDERNIDTKQEEEEEDQEKEEFKRGRRMSTQKSNQVPFSSHRNNNKMRESTSNRKSQRISGRRNVSQNNINYKDLSDYEDEEEEEEDEE